MSIPGMICVVSTWILISYSGYLITNTTDKSTKLKVMSCRKKLKSYKKLDAADNKSIL